MFLLVARDFHFYTTKLSKERGGGEMVRWGGWGGVAGPRCGPSCDPARGKGPPCVTVSRINNLFDEIASPNSYPCE